MTLRPLARFRLLLVAAALLLPAAASAAQAARPNVLVFLADDAGWGDYGFSGNTQVSTPNIDRIARGGASLDRFFVQPVCAPTRAEFLTGRWHPRGGVRGVSTGMERLDLSEKTIADAFKAAGYATGAFGKWHNGTQWPYHPRARGFDEYLGHTSGHWGEYFDAPLDDNGRMVRTSGYIVDVCTDRALQFITRNKDQPFFCYVPFTTPHSPWAVPDSYWQRFKNKPITQRATVPEQEDLDHTRCALAMIENQDWNVGRILARLDELKIADNTIIFYFSDNGPNSFRWTGGMRSRKGSTDEGGVRSVGYLRWPAKIPAGQRIPQIAAAVDLLPTLTSLAGIRRVGAAPLDGRDLSPLVLGQKTDWPDRMIFNAWNSAVSVRTQQHRLDATGRLYDMAADPGQTRDLAAERPAIAKQLTEAAAAYRKDMLAADAAKHADSTAKAGVTEAANARGKKKSGGAAAILPPDSRPYTVGYPEFPAAFLPARDGVAHGPAVKRSSNAPNSSYFVNWTSLDDRITWDIAVATTGTYDVVIDYTTPLADAGSAIELTFKSAKLTGKVAPGWDPPLYTNQDTLPRPPAESTMKPFKPLALGTVRLEKGRGLLTLRATQMPGKSVMDVRQVTLTLRK
ncbi:MAG: arylsulfatase [Opitutaceae bacterium]|nr:arylsulfatase [Opitutaceae bacterium]